MADSCWCMAKPIQYCKVKIKNKIKSEKKDTIQLWQVLSEMDAHTLILKTGWKIFEICQYILIISTIWCSNFTPGHLSWGNTLKCTQKWKDNKSCIYSEFHNDPLNHRLHTAHWASLSRCEPCSHVSFFETVVLRGFHAGPVGRSPHSQYRGPVFSPWSGN